jgi:hypothetical protein
MYGMVKIIFLFPHRGSYHEILKLGHLGAVPFRLLKNSFALGVITALLKMPEKNVQKQTWELS